MNVDPELLPRPIIPRLVRCDATAHGKVRQEQLQPGVRRVTHARQNFGARGGRGE